MFFLQSSFCFNDWSILGDYNNAFKVTLWRITFSFIINIYIFENKNHDHQGGTFLCSGISYKIKVDIKWNHKWSNRDGIVAVYGGSITVNGFLKLCNFLNFHMFIIGTSNALVSNIYGTVAFKIPVFFASLNEESPTRSVPESRW